jgi:hypothetical protein
MGNRGVARINGHLAACSLQKRNIVRRGNFASIPFWTSLGAISPPASSMDTASGSKYPPAKPVALICEPLKAVGPVALTRPGFLRHLSVARFYHHSATVLAADLPAPDA